MSKLHITRGYPAAGKTGYALGLQDKGWVRVNRDDIRRQVFGLKTKTVLDYAGEKKVSSIEKTLVTAALNAGRDVVVDATHLKRKYAVAWATLAHDLGASFEVIDFRVDADECVARDALRLPSDRVGEDVIRMMAKNFPLKGWYSADPESLRVVETAEITPYVPDYSLPSAYVFDVDGTLAQLGGGRNPYDASRAMEDTPIEHVRNIHNLLAADHKILILTGRKAEHRQVTEEWLKEYDIDYDGLWTRADDDGRPDWIIKQELFDTFIAPNYDVCGVFDDRLSVRRMWWAKGVPLFSIGDPDADF